MKQVKQIQGYPQYTISTTGEIISNKCSKPRIRKTTISRSGYELVRLDSDNGRSVNKTVHRLVAEAFIPNTEHKEQINHIDGDKLNNNVSNLEWCTRSENMKHAYANGIRKIRSGADGYNAKLTEKEVIEIRKLARDGIRLAEIVKRFPVKKSNIRSIITGNSWVSTPGAIPNYIAPYKVDYMEIKTLKESGLSNSEIGRKLGVSPSCVGTAIRKGYKR